jgi:choline dehydrogenase
MITIYPHNSDWQGLADLFPGDPSWQPEKMRDYFERLERCGYLPQPLDPDYNPSRHGFGGWLGTQQADPTLALGDPQLLKVIASAAVGTLAELLVQDTGDPLEVIKAFLSADPVDVTAALLRSGGNPLGALKGVLARHLDPNDWRISRGRREGVFSVPLATWGGHRNGPREFLRQAEAHPGVKLTIRPNALATRVELEKRDGGWAATGVRFLQGAHLYRADPNSAQAAQPAEWLARARREVILAGGTFNTPQLLMLSGIGPTAHLGDKGIDCRVPLEGVGQNLQDRYEVGVISELKKDFPILQGCGFKLPDQGQPADPCLRRWQTDGTGLYATNGAVLALVRRSRKDLPDPDLFIFGLPGMFKGYFVHYSDQIEGVRNRFTWAILKGHTNNQAGTVALKSSDPRDVPEIDFRYFDEGTPDGGEDLRAVVEGVKLVRRIMGQPSLAGLVTRNELIPGGEIKDDALIADSVKQTAWGHHACGTCKMGPQGDARAVVDGEFRVHGTQNLRVVDASVFPRIPGFFIVTSVYMISEKASDVIIAAAGKAPAGEA